MPIDAIPHPKLIWLKITWSSKQQQQHHYYVYVCAWVQVKPAKRGNKIKNNVKNDFRSARYIELRVLLQLCVRALLWALKWFDKIFVRGAELRTISTGLQAKLQIDSRSNSLLATHLRPGDIFPGVIMSLVISQETFPLAEDFLMSFVCGWDGFLDIRWTMVISLIPLSFFFKCFHFFYHFHCRLKHWAPIATHWISFTLDDFFSLHTQILAYLFTIEFFKRIHQQFRVNFTCLPHNP